MENQKGNLYLIIAIIVGVVAIGATGFASWKYFGGGSELEKNGNEITKPLIEKETEKSETITEISNWKTYNLSSSAMYSFEEYTIKYPHDWSYKEERKPGSRKVGILNSTFHNQKKEKKLSISAGEIFGEYSNKSLQKIQLGDNLFYKYQDNDGINYIYKTGVDRDIDENIETIIVFSFQNKDQKIIYQMLKSFNPLIDDIMNWKTYNNSEVNFTFKYPENWEITDDYFYKTASGIKAKQRTVILQKIGDEDSNNWIRINPRQFQCHLGKCEKVSNNIISTYSKNLKTLNIFNEIINSFKIEEKIEINCCGGFAKFATIKTNTKESEINGWNTLTVYEFDEYKMGFSIDYPSEFKVIYDEILDAPICAKWPVVTFFSSKDEEVINYGNEALRIEIDPCLELGWAANFQEWINYEKQGRIPVDKEEDIILDNKPAVKLIKKIDNYYRIEIYLNRNEESAYKIWTDICFEKRDIYLPIFNQMLSTFKFIN